MAGGISAYHSGEEVRAGDIVQLPAGTTGVIERVVPAASPDSAAYCCPQGGVLIREPVTYGHVLIEFPGGVSEGWGEVIFLRRGGDPSPAGGL